MHSGRPSPARAAARTDTAIVCLVLATVFYRFARTLTDPDLWGHVRFGLDTLAAGGVVRTDAYSYLSGGQPFLNHEWLAEVAFALCYRAFGGRGLVIVKLAIMMTVAALVYRHLMRRGVSALRGGIVLILMTVVLLMGAQTVRPQLFTYLFFTLLLLTLDAVSRGRRWLLWVTPVIFAVWANFHGGWMAGLGVFFAWAAVEGGVAWRRKDPDARRQAARFGLAAAATLGATLCTPYGLDLWKFVLHIVTVVPFEIGEWLPLRLQTTEGLGYLVVLGTAIASLIWSRVDRRPEWLVVFACMALAPLFSARHTPLFALTAAVVCSEHIASAWPAPRTSSPLRSPMIVVAICAFATIEMLVLGAVEARCVRLDPMAGEIYPVRAVALLRESGVEGNLALDYNWGEYVIWHLGPKVKVSVDGRWLEAYPPAMYAENMRFMSGLGDWDALIRRPETDLVLASKAFPVSNLMANEPHWARVYEDPVAAIYARQGSPLQRRLAAVAPPPISPNGAGSCFP
jgi:hypothetical protein